MKALLLTLLLLVNPISVSLAGDQLPDLKIRELRENVYLHISYQNVNGFGLVDSNGLILVDEGDAYVIDTPWSEEDTRQLVHWIKSRNLKLKGSISTHFHADRTAGIAVLNAMSVPTYASKRTNELLKQAGKAQATNEINGEDVWLLKDRLGVYYPGPGHSEDNVVVWLQNHRILFGGCLVRARETDSIGNVADANIGAWPKSIGNLESKFTQVDWVVPGHGKPGDVSLLAHTRQLASAYAKATE